ncbi:hypothetical protein PQX77_019869 [Marasmius sp. AFHP31]|nr:hypothetical protein PQX77_019869 [Marasmius sp. AFHP31]
MKPLVQLAFEYHTKLFTLHSDFLLYGCFLIGLLIATTLTLPSPWNLTLSPASSLSSLLFGLDFVLCLDLSTLLARYTFRSLRAAGNARVFAERCGIEYEAESDESVRFRSRVGDRNSDGDDAGDEEARNECDDRDAMTIGDEDGGNGIEDGGGAGGDDARNPIGDEDTSKSRLGVDGRLVVPDDLPISRSLYIGLKFSTPTPTPT